MENFFLTRLTRRAFMEKTAKACMKTGLSLFFLKGSFAMASEADEIPASGSNEKKFSVAEPGYLRLHRSGELSERAAALESLMKECRLCPRQCGADRIGGGKGFCQAPGMLPVIASASPHFGEERPLVGRGGSGTIFFSHCNLRCVFCQNWEISHAGRGRGQSYENLADRMLAMQRAGCHNINLVTPTHYSAAILRALDLAAEKGLRLPLVYNTSGWERMEVLSLLDGAVDIYLPDFKFKDSSVSSEYAAGAGSYGEITASAILEMHRQVGTALPESDGIMKKGLMIRHLVMPGHTKDSVKIIEWIARNLPENTYVNIMAQYNPAYRAFDHPEIARRISTEEYRDVVRAAEKAGLVNLDVRGSWWLR
ncbi:putative pyruvate formate lyase activating enzyme [Desulfobotulus alkaliphilus]|uniref:Putative pyruvate formate lyase activating enzyme n=1 Tax=Desulfobotulus alkaliphilus TaxID=622671 RepID=A0A562RY85_9BACT|nr:radical SAM protein [Desulfobotulus alkaliphilus]TWI74019.1 putative pyruvate formate lyase activating enzyme [Desulfobotulus alkaliphilus]